MKHLTDLQIWGCELHKNAFGGRAPPGPAAGAIAPPPDPQEAVIRGKGRGRKGLGIVKGREGREGVGRDEKRKGQMGREREEWEEGDRIGKGGLDLGYLFTSPRVPSYATADF